METDGDLYRLQCILEFQKTEAQEYLAGVLNNLPPDLFDDVVNNRLQQVTPAQVREFGLARLNDLDRYPNPRDGHLSIDEITEAIERASEPSEMAVLLYIWLHFDEIRRSSDDFSGHEKAFDYVLTQDDFERYLP